MTWQTVESIAPDAELWATGRLRALLAGRSETYVTGVKVDRKVPDPRPTRLVWIRRDGGAGDELFDNPRFGVNVFAASEQDAINLTRLVAAMFRRFPGDGVCVGVRQIGGPSEIPDAAPRRFMTFEARLRNAPLEV